MPDFKKLDTLRDELAANFPGWRVWYVPVMGREPKWCASPYPNLEASSPEHLADYITEAHDQAAAEWPVLANREDYAVSAPGVRRARLYSEPLLLDLQREVAGLTEGAPKTGDDDGPEAA